MSEAVPKIYPALAAVMADIDHVAKRDQNKQQNFKFRGIDAVVNAVGPVLRRHKVIVIPDVIDVSYALVSTSQGKASTACRLKVAYSFISGEDGSSIQATVAGAAWDWGDKATPKAMSVAFRTALLQALALPTDDPDPDAFTYERDRVQAPTPMGKKTQGQLFALFAQKGIPEAGQLPGINKMLGARYRSRGDLTEADALKVIESLKTMADALPAAPPAGEAPRG